MPFNTFIPKTLKPYFITELSSYKTAFKNKELSKAWNHLERAHIIGQKYPYEHTLIHWRMLLFGFYTKNTKEIIGQLPRLLVGGVKSFVGKIPLGNTGGANVKPLQPMPIEKELTLIFKKAGVTL